MKNIVLVLFGVLTVSMCLAQDVRTDSDGPDSATHITKAAILNDLDVYANGIRHKHTHPFEHVKKSVFLERIQAIKDSAERYDVDEIMLQIMQVNALLQDDLTGVGYIDTAIFPVNFYWYDDGIYLTAGRAEDKNLFGSRLVAINGIPVNTVVDKIKLMIPDKDPQYIKTSVPRCLSFPYILHGLQISSTRKDVVYTLVGPANDTVTLMPQAVNKKDFKLTCDCDVKDMFVDKGKDKKHWFRYSDSGNYIYFLCGPSVNNKKHPFKKLEEAFMQEVAVKKPGKIIIDLRYDNYGYKDFLQPLIYDLNFMPKKRQKQVYVLIGRRTFYSGVHNAVELKERTNAILVGEDTRGKDNDFWTTDSFMLPETKLMVNYSTGSGYDHPKPLKPDVAIPITYSNYTKGIDAALEYAIKH